METRIYMDGWLGVRINVLETSSCIYGLMDLIFSESVDRYIDIRIWLDSRMEC